MREWASERFERAGERIDAHAQSPSSLSSSPARYHILKLFTPFGKIRREEFLWHTHGPKRGEPRGFAFVEFSKREVRGARGEERGMWRGKS